MRKQYTVENKNNIKLAGKIIVPNKFTIDDKTKFVSSIVLYSKKIMVIFLRGVLF